jgi:protease IV
MASDRGSRIFLWVALGGGAFFIFVVLIFVVVYAAMRSDDRAQFGGFGGRIAVVDLDGVIVDPKPVVSQLKKYGDDDSVKAIILHIDSPGGGAAASEEIYREVRRLRDEKHKRIVASIETVGASGAYYVASATNKIYANEASIVGSIGVIAEWYNYADLIKWAKLKQITLKAGEFKDTGSPTRDMTPAEKAYMQALIDDMHQQFIHNVAVGRSTKDEQIKSIADGRVWTGRQAVSIKLIDQIADFQAAVQDTAKSVGIRGEPTLVTPEKERKSLLDLIFGDVSDLVPDRAKLMQTNVGFYYLWK